MFALACGHASAQRTARPTVHTPASPVDTWTAPVVPAAARQPDKQPPAPKPGEKALIDEKTDRAKYIRLPQTDDVFAFPNDPQLEQAVLRRLREEYASQVDPVTKKPLDPFVKYPPDVRFPQSPRVGEGVVYQPKTATYPPMRVNHEPLYVVHRRLHFEEKNAERYGWDLGIIQPLVSAAYFYKDVLLWPNSLASGVAYGFWDTSAGKCLPGSPTPYMLYPPGLTITGTVVEGVFVTGVAFAIP